MPEHIAGKTFLTPEEARAAGRRVLTPEEIAEANAKFDAWEKTRNPDAPAPVPFGGRFSDDLVGTEYDPEAPGYPDHMRKELPPDYPEVLRKQFKR